MKKEGIKQMESKATLQIHTLIPMQFLDIQTEDLKRTCEGAGIDLVEIELRSGIQASAIEIIKFCFEDDLIAKIMTGVFTVATCEALKASVTAIVRKCKKRLPEDNSKIESICLESSSAKLQIRKGDISEDTIYKAIDAFVSVSHQAEAGRGIQYHVVVGADEIEIMTRYDYVEKYLRKDSKPKEDTPND